MPHSQPRGFLRPCFLFKELGGVQSCGAPGSRETQDPEDTDTSEDV